MQETRKLHVGDIRRDIYDSDGLFIATVAPDYRTEPLSAAYQASVDTAAEMVRRWNAHEQLVAALEAVSDFGDDCLRRAATMDHDEVDQYTHGYAQAFSDVGEKLSALCAAALAAAETQGDAS